MISIRACFKRSSYDGSLLFEGVIDLLDMKVADSQGHIYPIDADIEHEIDASASAGLILTPQEAFLLLRIGSDLLVTNEQSEYLIVRSFFDSNNISLNYSGHLLYPTDFSDSILQTLGSYEAGSSIVDMIFLELPTQFDISELLTAQTALYASLNLAQDERVLAVEKQFSPYDEALSIRDVLTEEMHTIVSDTENDELIREYMLDGDQWVNQVNFNDAAIQEILLPKHTGDYMDDLLFVTKVRHSYEDFSGRSFIDNSAEDLTFGERAWLYDINLDLPSSVRESFDSAHLSALEEASMSSIESGYFILGDSGSLHVEIENGREIAYIEGHGLQLSFKDLPAQKINTIERIDISGEGNSLSISPEDVLFFSAEQNLLIITGEEGESVSSMDKWDNQGITILEGITYTEYKAGDATLLIENSIDQTGIV